PAVEVERDLPLQVCDQLRRGGELAGLLFLDRLPPAREPRLAPAPLYPTLHRGLRLLAPDGKCVDEQEPADVGRMRRGVGDRDAAAVREAEQVELLDAEMVARSLGVAG